MIDTSTGDKLPENEPVKLPETKPAKRAKTSKTSKLDKATTAAERQALLAELGQVIVAQGIFTPFGITLGREGGSFVFARQADDKDKVEAFRAEIAETAGDTRIIVIDADAIDGEGAG